MTLEKLSMKMAAEEKGVKTDGRRFNNRSSAKMEREIREIQRLHKKKKQNNRNIRSSKNMFSEEELADAKEYSDNFREAHRESAQKLIKLNKNLHEEEKTNILNMSCEDKDVSKCV